MLDFVEVPVSRPPGCGCGGALTDSLGNVVRVSTCPRCTYVALTALRGTGYAYAYVKCGDTSERVLLQQREFFRL